MNYTEEISVIDRRFIRYIQNFCQRAIVSYLFDEKDITIARQQLLDRIKRELDAYMETYFIIYNRCEYVTYKSTFDGEEITFLEVRFLRKTDEGELVLTFHIDNVLKHYSSSAHVPFEE